MKTFGNTFDSTILLQAQKEDPTLSIVHIWTRRKLKFNKSNSNPKPIKQKDPLMSYDVNLELLCCEIRLEPKITNKEGHEKRLSYWNDTRRTGIIQVGNICRIHPYAALINPHGLR